ncbi:hypothetical protein LG307_14700 [Sutcliffiella horikoshii]|uniref:hypothetical protein n=1 Tax=Sutcliffiella horikoshii TaxID=79883 RepID=UPI00384E51C1
MFYFHKIKSINFKEFTNGQYSTKHPRDIRLNSLMISPLAMFDPLVLSIAAGILSIVFLEKFLLNGNLFHLGEFLGKFINAVCPVLLFGAIIYFFFTNPFIGW